MVNHTTTGTRLPIAYKTGPLDTVPTHAPSEPYPAFARHRPQLKKNDRQGQPLRLTQPCRMAKFSVVVACHVDDRRDSLSCCRYVCLLCSPTERRRRQPQRGPSELFPWIVPLPFVVDVCIFLLQVINGSLWIVLSAAPLTALFPKRATSAVHHRGCWVRFYCLNRLPCTLQHTLGAFNARWVTSNGVAFDDGRLRLSDD